MASAGIGRQRTQRSGVRGQAAGTGRHWVEFCRSDAAAVIAMVRAVAEARDPGEYGQGVEVLIEAPRLGRLAGLFNHDDRLAQARIVVTRAGGEVTYPFDIQLVTAYGGDAGHRLPAQRGWAVSNSAGLAFLIQKGRPGARFEFGALVGGAVLALTRLRRRSAERGWRATVDRSVRRA